MLHEVVAFDLRAQLASVPDVDLEPSPAVRAALEDSVRYLASDDAQRSLDADVYWPKWHSPWWHALLIFEIGEAYRIPRRAVTKIVERLAAYPIKIFPIRPHDAPPR